MTAKEICQLISDNATDILKRNEEYIRTHHQYELETLSEEDRKDVSVLLGRFFTSYLRTGIELGTLNAIEVLQGLGVVPSVLKKDSDS